MAEIDHWHPVLLSRNLGRAPVGVRLAGRDLVVFRTASGQLGCLDEMCPHRRMKLSHGRVDGEHLRCKYHGWTFDACGRGESPATPKLYACAGSYETREAFGVVWVKPPEADAAFPRFEVEDYYHSGSLLHRAIVPLELAMDNFCEIEHTPTTHAIFGYELDRMHEVKVRFEPTETTVRVINRGPPKRFGPAFRFLLGIGRDFEFVDDWTTHFSPVYSVYDHWWLDPRTGRENMVRWRLYIFFVPEDERATKIVTLSFLKSRWPGKYGGARLFKWLMRQKLDAEIRLDVNILAGLASHDTSIEGMKLSRFDRVLGLNRERLERVYRGQVRLDRIRKIG